MTYTTVCKPGDIFYGRLRVGYEDLLKVKVLSILITQDDGIWYYCEYSKLNEKGRPSSWHFTEEDFKTLMFKTPEAAQKDFEKRKKLYALINDSSKEIRFEENLKIARKLIEEHIATIENLPKFCNFSEPEYLYVKDLFQEQIESEEIFNAKMQKGYDDAIQDRVKTAEQSFVDIKKRFE